MKLIIQHSEIQKRQKQTSQIQSQYIVQSKMQEQPRQKIILDLPIQFSTRLKVDSKSKVQLGHNNTLVVSVRHRNAHLINNYNSSGQVLVSLPVENLLDFTMVSPTDVVIVRENKQEKQLELMVWNVVTKACFTLGLAQIRLGTGSQCYMYMFRTTKLFAFCHTNDKIVQIFYYKLPLHEDDDPFHVNRVQITGAARLFKLNEHSMIGIAEAVQFYDQWYGHVGRMNGCIKFVTYSLLRKGKGGLQKYQISRYYEKKGKKYENISMGNSNLPLEIKDIWELRPGVVYIQCQNISQRFRRQQLQRQAGQDRNLDNNDNNNDQQQRQPIYLSYYLNTSTKLLLKSKLTSQLLDAYRLQFITSMRTVNTVEQAYYPEMKKSMPKNVPVYYIDPLMEQIESKYMGEYHKFGYGNFCWPSYGTGWVLEYQFDFYKSEMNVKVRFYCPTWQGIRVIVGFFVDEIVEECDDDLVDYVCGMIGEEGRYGEEPYGYLQILEGGDMMEQEVRN